MCALPPQKCGDVYGRARKGCCLIPMLAMHPCIHSCTLSLPNRSSRTVKRIFVFFVIQGRFSGAARLSRAPKNARCSAKAPPCSVSHVLLRSCRRILGAPILSPQVLTLAGVGWCRRSWSGLAVAGDPTELHNLLLFMFP
jgi:hypothetical protein